MKNIKRTLSLMIVAGLLTASLASCVVKGDGEGSGEVPSGTEPQYSITTNPNNNTPTPVVNDPTQVTYTEANDYVYVAKASAAIKLASDTTQTKNLSQFTELNRIGTSSKWYKVKYEDQEYYVAADLVTTDDIGEKTFVACDKTLYTTDPLKIRPYPSTDNTFSKSEKSVEKATEIKVVAQSEIKGWSKIEYTSDGTTWKGFMSTKYLTPNASGVADDFEQHFKTLDNTMTMYVSVGQVALRARPYKDGAEKDVLKKGTEVKVLATGTVEGMEWCAVEYEENYETMNYYVAADCLSLVGVSLEQLLSYYDELEKFDTPKTFYICEDQVAGRSTPVVDETQANYVTTLSKATAVKAVAMGTFAVENGATMTWCLIEKAENDYYFVAYHLLTSNSDGTPAPAVADLGTLLKNYGFTAVTESTKTFKVDDSGLYGVPSTTSTLKKLAKGTEVKVVAKGETTTKYGSKTAWYIVEYQNSYYFAIQKVLE